MAGRWAVLVPAAVPAAQRLCSRLGALGLRPPERPWGAAGGAAEGAAAEDLAAAAACSPWRPDTTVLRWWLWPLARLTAGTLPHHPPERPGGAAGAAAEGAAAVDLAAALACSTWRLDTTELRWWLWPLAPAAAPPTGLGCLPILPFLDLAPALFSLQP